MLVGLCAAALLAVGLPATAADAPAKPAAAQATPVAAPIATVAPTAAPVRADAHNAAGYWRGVRHGDVGVTTIKGAETGVLVQMDGEAWREVRNGPVTFWGGLLLLLTAAAIFGFHSRKGTLQLSRPASGRKVSRFSRNERIVHNTVAGSFVLLAVGGLLLLFGKHVLMPVFGHTLVSLLMQLLKPIHNFIGLVFLAGLVVMILMWAKDNLWAAVDAQWIRRAGGLIDRSHVPSWRFNFGEKTWFWFGVTLLGLTVAVSGLLLDFPAILEVRAKLQAANLVHGIGALAMILLAFGHIYMGTIGVAGAIDSMKTGEVDEVWAEEHHELWYRQVTGHKE
jgi:formate dehydrogenase subunit gamma